MRPQVVRSPDQKLAVKLFDQPAAGIDMPEQTRIPLGARLGAWKQVK